MLEKTWVKVVSIILAGLLVLGMGFWGVNAMLKNTSRSANSTESSKSSSETSVKEEQDLPWDKKLIVLMDNQKNSISISAKELRDGHYVATGIGTDGSSVSVSEIKANPLPNDSYLEGLNSSLAKKKAEMFKVMPTPGGSLTYFYVDDKKATLLSAQNMAAETLDNYLTSETGSVTMTNEEMKKYYEKHEKELAPLVDKVHVDSKNKNANSKPAAKQESKPQEQKQEQAKPEKKASDLSLKEQQALALLALPAKMYSNYGDITGDMILAGNSPANSSNVDKLEEVNFGAVELKPELDKFMIHLADLDIPDSMKNPPYYVIGSIKVDGDTVTYKTQGTRNMPSPEEEKKYINQGITDPVVIRQMADDSKATVVGTESLQALYNKYKDDPKFEQMQTKIK